MVKVPDPTAVAVCFAVEGGRKGPPTTHAAVRPFGKLNKEHQTLLRASEIPHVTIRPCLVHVLGRAGETYTASCQFRPGKAHAAGNDEI